ncbi:acyltransferase [Mucilaginibacter terrae]|uniref:acyltransferase n=1 Tax=Mucilaginibacter terrae TaxID=1955052 RepID=UPI003628DCD9
MKETNTRLVWIDNVRVIATIAVIMVHVATPAVFTQYNPNSASNTVWWIGNMYDSLCRFCVPVFVMLTGALLLPQTISLSNFLKKRLNRIMLPFLFWSSVYIVFNLALKFRDEGSQVAMHNIGHWLILQLTQGAAPHLWYVYMIIGLYLFIPIIQPWVSIASNKAIIYFLGIWFITLLFHQQKLLSVTSPLDLSYFTGYIGYLILGYFIAERLVISKAILYCAIILFITGVAATLAATYLYTYNQGSFSHTFYEYLTLNVLFAAIGIFIIIKNQQGELRNNAINTVRDFVSRYGYGIYLSHLLVISILSHFKIDYSLITPVIGIPLTTLICLLISAALVYIVNKLPYGKYISG